MPGSNRPCWVSRGLAACLLAVSAGSLPVAAASAADSAPRRVVSLNLCTDQMLLLLADRDQILSISWLGADPEESAYADLAEGLRLNHGRVEEILPLQPDLVLAGSYTAPFTVALLQRLGHRVLVLPPAETLDSLEAHLLILAEALGQGPRGEAMVAELQGRRARLRAGAPDPPVPALVLRAGGFTTGAGLTHELMQLAGLRNLASELGLDSWGSLSVETLLRTEPAVLIVPSYRRHEASLANATLEHPALRGFRQGRVVVEPRSADLGCETPAMLEVAYSFQHAAREALR